MQRSAKADPLADTPAIGDNPVAGAVPGIAPSAVTSLSPAQIERLLERGKGLLENGDIASARLLFLRVAAAGDGRGARGVGMTYDPSVYARLPVAGLTPDRAQAEFWYKKAGDTASFVLELKTPPAAEPVKPQAQQSAAWRAACARKYKSFVPSTGLYTALSGAKRRCVLP